MTWRDILPDSEIDVDEALDGVTAELERVDEADIDAEK